MKIRFKVSFSLAMLFPTAVIAQQHLPVSPNDSAAWSVGATQVRAGGMSLGLDTLNADFARNGRPTFSNSIPTLGFS